MFQSIRVRDYMARNLVILAPETEVLHAIHILAENNISGAPVVDGDGRLVGILSERDFMRVVLEAGYYQGYGGRVGGYMSKNVVTIDPDESIMELAKRFMDAPYRRYPVMENDCLIGQISRRDVIRVLEDLW